MNVVLHTPAWPRSLHANGIVTAVELLVEPLQALGEHVRVLTWEGEIGPGETHVRLVPEEARPRGVARTAHGLEWRMDRGGANRRLGARRILRSLQELAAGEGVDVVEIEEAFGLTRHLEAEVPGALVLTLHGPWFLHGPMQGRTVADAAFRDRVRAEGIALRGADLVIAPARDVLRRTRRYYRLDDKPTAIIPYAVPLSPPDERWRLERCEAREILFVGRFDRHKGGDLVIDAFARVAAREPRARLVFVGPDSGLVDAQGRRWSLEEYTEARLPGALRDGRVELTGQLTREDVDRRRLHALVTLSCSRWENLSLAVLEAMAAGCPLVVSDSGGVPEHVHDRRTGRVFRAGDAEDLAGCILDLLADPAGAAELGRRALEHAGRELDPARIASLRVEAYRRAIAARSGTRSA